MLSTGAPAYSLGPLMGLAVNGTLCLLAGLLALVHSHYAALRGMFCFYLSLAVFYLGYAAYGYQTSEASIIFWYRVMLAALVWMPLTWAWLANQLYQAPPGRLFKAAVVLCLATTVSLFIIDSPAVIGLPLEYLPRGGVWRPQSWLMRPVLHLAGIAVVAFYIYRVRYQWWPGPKRPAFVELITLGLVIWVLSGLHDSAYAAGFPYTLDQCISWLGSIWLSACLVLGVALYFRDLESTLAETQEHFRALVSSSEDGIIGLDADWRITTVNPAALKLYGYREQDLIGKPGAVLQSGLAQASQFTSLVMRHLARELGAWRGEWELTAEDGRQVPTEITLSALNPSQGRPGGYVAIMRDITQRRQAETERRNLERELRQARKMEAVGTLAGGVAHDFNNILQAIRSFAQLLEEQAEKLDEEGREFLEQIKVAVARAAELVQRLLTFSRKVEPQLRPLNLNQEVGLAVKLLKAALPRMVSIETRLEPEILPVNGDPNQLAQIFMNLGGNAKDAMPEGGKLVLSTANVTLDQESAALMPGLEPGPHVMISVGDDGMGMDPEAVQHIFEPFFTTKPLGKGTGLGLATVYGIVQAHGGHIACQSNPGTGTEFCIYLPALPAMEQAGTAPEDVSDLARGSETVLLVDDEASLRTAAGRLLTRHGYTVISAASGEEALEIYGRRGGEIDAVLLDLSMPGMGGHRTLSRLLTLDPMAKVIVISGYSSQGTGRQTLSAGAAAFLGKPFEQADLISLLRQTLDRPSPRSAAAQQDGPGSAP